MVSTVTDPDDTEGFSDQQLLAYSIATRCAAGFSFLCSSYLARKAFQNRAHIYHRLMLGLAVHLIIFNSWHLYGASAIPEFSYRAPASASGTTQTCTAQGFGLQLSFAVPFYYVSLSIYSFLAVRHNFQVKKYLWTEKWIHLAVHVFPVASAAWLLHLEAFNFAGNGVVCWIDSIPHGCGDGTLVECTRGPQNITQVAALCAALPTFFVLIFPTCVMSALYVYVRRNQNIITRIEAKTVAKQAVLYLCALYWAYLWTMVASSLRLIADQHIYGLAVLSTVNLNLLGFYILLIYLYFGPTRHRQQKKGKKSNGSSDENNNTRSEVARRTEQRPGRATTGAAHECSGTTSTFNIFDGSNPGGNFAAYIFDADSDDLAFDQEESARWADIQEHL